MVTKVLCLVAMMLVVRTHALGYYGGGPPPLTPVAFPLMPPVMPGFHHGGYGGGAPRMPQAPPEMLTCIAKDLNDPTSQIRLTVSNSRSVRTGGGGGGFFGGFDDDDFDDFDDFDGGFFGTMGGGMMGGGGGSRNDEYRVDGTFIPSLSINKAGTYQVVVTTYGRTADGCSADALGPIYQGRSNVGGGGGAGFGMGGFGMGGLGGGFGAPMGGMGFGMPMGMGMGMGGGYMGPYSQNMYNGGGFWNQGQQQQQAMIGQLHNPAIVGGSATIYSAHVNGVSKNDLLGRGIALCRSISNGRCEGYIPYCCTIQRDSLPAMELFVQSQASDDNNNAFPMGGFGGNIAAGAPIGGGGAIGLGGPGGNIGGGGQLGGGGGLF